MNKLTPQLSLNIKETLEDFKCLITRYTEVKNDSLLLKKFCNRNRNPIFDLTNNNHFKTGLESNESLKTSNTVEDHFIQRTKAISIIFQELEENPEMEVKEFYFLLKKYCSTITLTKEEHSKVTKISRQMDNNSLNWEIYEKCGIVVEGIDDLVWEIESPNFNQDSKKNFEEQYNYLLKNANIPTIL